MSFFFETIAIPFWFIVFVFASATPLWIKWYQIFYKKFIMTGILKKIFRKAKTNAEMKMDVLKKSTDHWNANSEHTGFADSSVSGFADSGISGFANSEVRKSKPSKGKSLKNELDQIKKQNIRTVLKVLAEGGEKGVLPKSISDKTNITTIDTKTALTYLIEKKYAEEINSTSGTKYYLTDVGRKYCINKKYINQ